MSYFDEQIEFDLIGAMLVKKSAYLDTFDIVKSDDFYVEALGNCYDLLSDAFKNETSLSLPEVIDQLKLSPSIVPRLLVSIHEGDISLLFAKGKAKRIRELANKRRVYTGCRQLIAQIETLEPIELSTRLSEIASMVSMSADSKCVYDAKEMNRRVVELQEARHSDPGIIRGILTGYEGLDSILRGLRPKRMTVIAAGTGFGKTTLALNLFDRVIDAGHRALFISNENDVDDNLDRLCAMGAGINLNDVEGGMSYRPVCLSFKEKYTGKHAFLSDNSPRTVDEVVVTMQRYVMQHQVEIVFVDYIGEISGDSLKSESEEAKLTRYTQRLLDAAKQMGVHLVLLAQLNREGNKSGKPSKTELAGCFKIAQKAHSMLLFWSDDSKNDIITVEKNRQGAAHVDIKMSYDRAKQLISEDGFWDNNSKTILRVSSQHRNPKPHSESDTGVVF